MAFVLKIVVCLLMWNVVESLLVGDLAVLEVVLEVEVTLRQCLHDQLVPEDSLLLQPDPGVSVEDSEAGLVIVAVASVAAFVAATEEDTVEEEEALGTKAEGALAEVEEAAMVGHQMALQMGLHHLPMRLPVQVEAEVVSLVGMVVGLTADHQRMVIRTARLRHQKR